MPPVLFVLMCLAYLVGIVIGIWAGIVKGRPWAIPVMFGFVAVGWVLWGTGMLTHWGI